MPKTGPRFRKKAFVYMYLAFMPDAREFTAVDLHPAHIALPDNPTLPDSTISACLSQGGQPRDREGIYLLHRGLHHAVRRTAFEIPPQKVISRAYLLLEAEHASNNRFLCGGRTSLDHTSVRCEGTALSPSMDGFWK